MKKLKITERGFAGHFCASHHCSFRRNTLIEYGTKRVVVSSVGAYRYEGKIEAIGCDRWYETMVFWAHKKGSYWEANVSQEIHFKGELGIFEEPKEDSDLKMDRIHDAVVQKIAKKLQNGTLTPYQ